jgi:hypothetical protein
MKDDDSALGSETARNKRCFLAGIHGREKIGNTAGIVKGTYKRISGIERKTPPIGERERNKRAG